MTSRKFAALCFLFVIVPFASVSAKAATVEEARSFVDKVGSKALEVIKTQGADKSAKQKKLEDLFADSVDIKWVGRFVLGLHWRRATDAQKERYLTEYKDFLLKHYAGRFAEYSGGSYTIDSARENGSPEKFQVVMTITVPDEPSPVNVQYMLHEKDGKLKIYDVVVEDISMITTQRDDFAAVVNSKGLDYLIDQLNSKSASVASSS